MENEICSIRAGRLLLSGGQLNADARKGLLRLAETEDTLVHVQWFERTATGRADAPEEDTIVFPGEAVLEKIPGQRAVVLKFPEDKSRNVFYWIQEPRGTEAADDQRIAAFNAGINRTPDAGVDAAAVAPVSGVAPSSALEHAHVASEAGAGAMLDKAGRAAALRPWSSRPCKCGSGLAGHVRWAPYYHAVNEGQGQSTCSGMGLVAGEVLGLFIVSFAAAKPGQAGVQRRR